MTTSPRWRSRRPKSRKPTSLPRPKPPADSRRPRKRPKQATAGSTQSPPSGGLCFFNGRKRKAGVAHRAAQRFGRLPYLRWIAAHSKLDVAATAVLAHRGQAEHLDAGVCRADGLHGGDELALARLEHQDRFLAPTIEVEKVAVAGVEHPLHHGPRHLRKPRHEVMLAIGEAWDPVDRIRDDARALREFAHSQPRRGGFGAEAGSDFALGFRMQEEPYPGGRSNALTCVIVRGRTYAAETEHRLAGGEAAAKRRGEPPGLIAQVLRPGKSKPSPGEGLDRKGKMLVLALADQDLVTNDVGAKQSGRFLSPFLQLFEAADVPAVDEHLRHGAAPGDRANDPRTVAVIELHFRVRVPEALQQGLRLGAEPAPLARENGHLVGLLRPGIDVVQHRVGVGHFERIAGLLGLDEHLLDHPVSH